MVMDTKRARSEAERQFSNAVIPADLVIPDFAGMILTVPYSIR
jgi:hypothetical protein